MTKKHSRGGSRGCPDTRPFDTVPFLEKNIFSKRAPIRRIFGFWRSKVPQYGRFHAQDAHEGMNHHAQFDATSFIPGGEIRNRTVTNLQTNKQ